ncbi:hypothetical protein DPMN_175778 [Dreissena polymorpha]|uniref:Uncharacterized protein n=1 Tax=Dreissena polymorpha TaxID=45954 RepID=A0A9D4IGC8_DREPO|nr:hypothetical protein DPMN_175778 [Dreissena polymorpha]
MSWPLCDEQIPQHQYRHINARPPTVGNSRVQKDQSQTDHGLQDDQLPCAHISNQIPFPWLQPDTG